MFDGREIGIFRGGDDHEVFGQAGEFVACEFQTWSVSGRS